MIYDESDQQLGGIRDWWRRQLANMRAARSIWNQAPAIEQRLETAGQVSTVTLVLAGVALVAIVYALEAER